MSLANNNSPLRYDLCLLLLVAACAGSAPPADPTHTTTVKTGVAGQQTMDLTRQTVIKQTEFAAPRERVWDALMAAHQALGIPLSSGDMRTGVAVFEVTDRIRTLGGKPASRYVDCGQGTAGPRTESYRLTFKLTHMLENTAANTTTLKSLLEARARHPAVTGEPIGCHSLGLLEQEITTMVATRLQ